MLKSAKRIFSKSGEYVATLTTSGGSITLAEIFNKISYSIVGKTITISGVLIVSSVDSPLGFVRINLPAYSRGFTSDLDIVSGLTENKTVVLTTGTDPMTGTLSVYEDGGFSDLAEFVQVGTEFYINITYITE